MPTRVGFRLRALALAIDATLVLLASFLFGPWLGIRLGLGEAGAVGPAGGGMMHGAMAGSALIGLAYFLSEGLTGATPGKRLLRLRIGTAAGHEATRGRTLLRWACKHAPTWLALLAVVVSLGLPRVGGLLVLLSNLTGLGVVAGCFLALGAGRQALHDRIAQTAVFQQADLLPPEAT